MSQVPTKIDPVEIASIPGTAEILFFIFVFSSGLLESRSCCRDWLGVSTKSDEEDDDELDVSSGFATRVALMITEPGFKAIFIRPASTAAPATSTIASLAANFRSSTSVGRTSRDEKWRL